jgi:PAS domain S-box-containing protein
MISAEELGIDAAEAASRWAFLEFGPEDVELLRSVHDELGAYRDSLTTSFYDHLFQEPELASMLGSGPQLDSLRRVQGSYFESLTSGEYGTQYVQSRVRVGAVHQLIGLKPKWYVGASRKYMSLLIPALHKLLAHDSERLIRTVNAMQKVLMFDIGIALEAYFEAGRRNVRQAEYFSQTILDNMPSGLLLLTQDLQILQSNRALWSMLQISNGPGLIGQRLDTGFPIPSLAQLCRRAEAERSEIRSEILRPGEGDAIQYLDVSVSSIASQKGRQFLIMLQDVTARRTAEESARRFRLAIDMSADAIVLIDKESHRVIDTNNAACKMFGYTREQLLGMHSETITPHHDADARRHSFEQLTGARQSADLVETIARRSDGSEFPVEVTRRAMFVAGKWQVVSVKRDISERKNNERRLAQLNAELEARVQERTAALQMSNRDLEAYSYTIAHDLRGPLRALSEYPEIMRSEKAAQLDTEGRDMLGRISTAAQRMSELVAGLLELARLRREPLTLVEIDLSALAENIANELRAADTARQVNFEIDAGLVIFGDLGMTRSLMLNLMSNAWKFTRQKPLGHIRIGRLPARPGSAAEFFVADNGAGFDMAQAGRLFRSFQRLHRQNEFEGNGIGLATVQRIVDRHAGSIRVDARPGIGANFYFTLQQTTGTNPGVNDPR